MNNVIERCRGRRGVALPVALVGLVAASLLVTTALLTAGTESAISSAQANGARALYDAEGGLQEYLRLVTPGVGVTAGVSTVTLPENGRQVRITRARVERQTVGTTVQATMSLLAEPLVDGQPRGRAVVAFVRQNGTFATMNLNVQEGAVVGSDLEVGGNSRVIDRSTLCADTSGGGAVKHASGTRVTTSGSGEISGAVRRSRNRGLEFQEEILGAGRTLTQFADLAEIKFGARWRQPPWPNNGRASANASDPMMRWGCPTQVGVTCPNPADTLYYPIIAIDAQAQTIDIQGDYGQGILIVLNGSLQITGNFVFKGLLMVDGYIDMTGTGGTTGAKVEGSVIAFGNNTNGRHSHVDESETTGNTVIAYNKCAIQAAQNSFNQRASQSPSFGLPSRSYAWYEVVR